MTFTSGAPIFALNKACGMYEGSEGGGRTMARKSLRTTLCGLLFVLVLATFASPRGRCYLNWLQERLPPPVVSTRTTIFISIRS